MTQDKPYELVLTPPAVRAIQHHLSQAVATAVIEFVTGAFVASPQCVGKPLRGDLAGIHSARRGTYRVLYRIHEDRHEVIVLRIDHRRAAYRDA
jgi:mRNA-degrading endonuclease RelE of RelBE toxin-antitoxin system